MDNPDEMRKSLPHDRVRSYLKTLHSVTEFGRPRRIRKTIVSCRMTSEDVGLIKAVAARYGMTGTACAEMLLEQAVRDACDEFKIPIPSEQVLDELLDEEGQEDA